MPNRNRALSKRILIADDDPAILTMLKKLVEAEGYSALSITDGRAAYRKLLSDSDFAAVILDVKMPHLKGLDIVRYMKSENRLMAIPVITMSGDAELRLVEESFAAGASAFLRKPFTVQQMEMTLRLVLSQNHGSKSASASAPASQVLSRSHL